MQQGRDDVYRAHLELRGLNAAFFHSSSLRLRLRTVSRPLFAGMGARVSLRNSAGLGSLDRRPTGSDLAQHDTIAIGPLRKTS